MNFEMTGKLSISKDTEKFHPYSETKYEKSGWVRRRLLFNVTCGDSRHMLTVDAGSFEDGHGDVYTYSKPEYDSTGKKIKDGEKIQIPFKDRLTSPKLEEVSDFRKFVFDLEKPGRRYKLKNALEKIKEGKDVTDKDLAEVGLTSVDELEKEYEKSKKRHHEFISEWDYAEFIKKVIDSGKYDDCNFHIRGRGDYSYSDDKERFYENLIPNRIYLAADDDEPYSTATMSFVFGAESLDETSVEEDGKYYVNGFVFEYIQSRKKKLAVPATVVIPVPDKEKDESGYKKANGLKRKFIVDDEDKYMEYGIVVDMINGSQRVELTEDMLSEEQRDDLECGIITMEEIQKAIGGSAYGDKVKEYQLIKPSRNGIKEGVQDTVYTAEDMEVPALEIDENEDLFSEESIDNDNDDDDDLFD